MSGSSALVVVTSSFPIRGDGSEAAGAFVADLAIELAKQVPVRVVAPGHANGLEQWAAGVEVFRYATPDQALSTLRLWHPVDAINVHRVLRAGQQATDAAVAAGPTAHVLALWALPCGNWARRTAKRQGIEYSVWTLGSDIWSLGRIPVVRSLLRRVLHDAEYCWSDGLQLRDDTQDIAMRPVEFLASTRRINRLRTKPLKSQPPYHLLFLGRWHANKGVDLLVDALKLLVDEDWRRIAQISICGGGPLESLVRAGVTQLQAAGRPVVMQGYLARVNAELAMLDADYLLIPSRVESIPVVFSDALKVYCPAISTPVGDLADLISAEPRCGVLATSVSAAGIATAIAQAINSSPVEFLPGIKRCAEAFDLTSIAERIVAATSQ